MPEQPVSIYTVVRRLLTDHFQLSTDALIARAKERGITRTDAEIRKVVNKTRSEMRARRARKGGRAAKVPAPSAYTLAREILAAEPGATNDDVLARVKARGVTKGDAAVRDAIRSTRNDLRRKAAKPVPVVVGTTAEPGPMAGAPDEAALFAGVALVNKTAHLCGGVAKTREVVEAIRASGGIDAFLVRLDLVAEILGSDTDL